MRGSTPKKQLVSEGSGDVRRAHALAPLTTYLDFRHFLHDFYRNRNDESDGGFSYADWASQAGFSSRSFIRLIIQGKRNLTESALVKLVPTLRLHKREELYFCALVRFNQAATQKDREHGWQAVLAAAGALSRGPGEALDAYEFLSSCKSPLIFVYLTLEDVDRSPHGICQALGISKSQVNEILASFLRLQIVDEIDGQWVARHAELNLPDQLNHHALNFFHQRSLERAAEAVQLASEIRHYGSTMVPLSPAEYTEAVETMKASIQAVLKRFGANCAEGRRRLYQFNTNLIPVSEPLFQRQNSPSAPRPDAG